MSVSHHSIWNLRQIAAAAALAAVCTSACFGQEIALLLGKGGHNNEFDAAFKALGWKDPDRFECSVDGMKRLTDSISKYDMVIAVPLFNYEFGAKRGQRTLVKGDTDTGRIRSYIQNGGVFIITDGSYSNVRDWLAEVDPAFGGLTTGECTSSQWGVLGYVRNAQPVHAIRCFPNMITEGDSWPHFENLPPKSKWQVLAYCSEGKPVCLYQKYGKGYVVLTCLRQPGEKILENYYANCMLMRANLSVDSFVMSEFKPGPGSIELRLSAPPPAGSSLILEVVDSKNKTYSFSTNIVGQSCRLEYLIEARGEVNSALYVNTPKGKSKIFSRDSVLPQLFEVRPNAYRGVLSTKRRTDDVDFLLKFAPAAEDITSAKVTLEFYDSSSNIVHTQEITTPTNAVSELWVPVPLSKKLGAGGYAVRAHMSKGRINAKSETSFEILPPRIAQTIIDEDNTMLVNGQPYFPLGIYHINSDYEAVSELGFTACQFWKWQTGNDGFGAPIGLYQATANKLKCLFESNHWGEEIFKTCVSQYADHPAILMWYVADEPAEGAESKLQITNDAWHKYDKQHPTYILSCRPDLFPVHQLYGDILAFNPFGNKGQSSAVNNAITWIKQAKEATDGRKCLVIVPWGMQSDFNTSRYITYAAIAHDIRGIFWYCWSQTGGGPIGIGLSKNVESQKKFKGLMEEIKLLLPGLLTHKRRTFEEGDIHGIVCSGTGKDQRLVVMMNVSDKTVDSDFEIPEIIKVKKIFNALTGQPAEKIENGIIKRKFKPFEVMTLKW